MNVFKQTTYLQEILEESEKNKVVVFKYSSQCGSSEKLSKQIEKIITDKKLKIPIYKVTVQEEPVLSKKIAEWFKLKHETPQILVLEKGKIIYTEHHSSIDPLAFLVK